MRRLGIAVFGIVVIGIMLVIGRILFGRDMPPTTHIQEFRLDVCKLPCWLGIEVGKITVGEAKKLIYASYPNSQYISAYDGIISLTGQAVDDPMSIRLNNPDDHLSQLDTAIVTKLELLFSPKRPLTAAELFGLVGEPELVSLLYKPWGRQLYVLYCGLNLGASPFQYDIDIVSLYQEIGYIEIHAMPTLICQPDQAIAWEGFKDDYYQRLQIAFPGAGSGE